MPSGTTRTRCVRNYRWAARGRKLLPNCRRRSRRRRRRRGGYARETFGPVPFRPPAAQYSPCTSRAAATAPCPEPSIVHDRRRPLSFCPSAASVAGPQCFEYSQAGHCRCARPFGRPHACPSAARRARALSQLRRKVQVFACRLGRCPRPIEGSLRIGVLRPAPFCGVLERALRTIGHSIARAGSTRGTASTGPPTARRSTGRRCWTRSRSRECGTRLPSRRRRRCDCCRCCELE